MSFYDDPADLEPTMVRANRTRRDVPNLGHRDGDVAGGVATANGTLDLNPTLPIAPPGGDALALRTVSGSYQSSGGGFKLELRVDVDGIRPLWCVSGDYFQVNGETTSYYGSFVLKNPAVNISSTTVTVEGEGEFTWASAAPRLQVTILRRTVAEPAAPASATFLTTGGAVAATYVCQFRSPFFRSVQIEQDSVAGIVPFVSYHTDSLPRPAGGLGRLLSVAQAFAESGVEIQSAGTVNAVDTSAAGSDGLWSDAELHAAMVANFSLWSNLPQWRVWLFVATAHEEGYRGIMFDTGDTVQRQGCAVFNNAIAGGDPASQRAQLRTYIHELGHCFNLLHSWDKALADPPAPLGPNGGLGDLSWMNYGWKYQPPLPAPGGEAAYWSSFDFQFTENEVVHLRHAFYRNIVFGGSPFGVNSADIDPALFADRTEDYSGLALEVRPTKSRFALGEPVTVELKLSTTDTRGKRVHGYLHPKDSFVQISIRKPSGQVVLYRPLMQHCVDQTLEIDLAPDRPALYDSIFIGYGKDGFYFQEPGLYLIRAMYVAHDGSRVVSSIQSLRVRSPYTAQDEDVADLFFGDDQGKLLCLLGSDSPTLKSGTDAFKLVIDKHEKHPLAVYARMAEGINAQRNFKSLTTDKSAMVVRPADNAESVQMLTSVVDASTGDKGVDNITLNMVIGRLASAQTQAGDLGPARTTLDRMVDVFKKKKVKPLVLQTIAAQAEVEKAKLKLD